MTDPIREPRTGFQPEPEFVTIADTVIYQGPPPEATGAPELPLTPDEHRRGEISQETAKHLIEVAVIAADRLEFRGECPTAAGLRMAINKAEKELAGEQ